MAADRVMTGPNPLTDKEFSEILGLYGVGPNDGPFAVAVSGGADSMALALLFANFAGATYLTFDHDLRADSAVEAMQVHDWLTARGLSHHILKWPGKKPKTGIQAAARAARYQAMEAWCKKNGMKYLVVAHHMEDQAETFLMRLLKGSGVDGLAAMAPRSPGLFVRDIVILRPLLEVPKARLKAFMEGQNQAWIDDPGNENINFTRIKIRKILERSQTLDPKTLAEMAGRIANVKEFLDDMTENLLGFSLETSALGFATLDKNILASAPEEILSRALSKVLMFISQGNYPPALEKLERLGAALKGKDFKGMTLGGCQVLPHSPNKILICREVRNLKSVVNLTPGEEKLWDNRLQVSHEGEGGPLKVCPLGEVGWTALATNFPAVKEVDIPHQVRAGLPAFYHVDKLVSVPHLNFLQKGYSAKATFKPKRPLFP